MVKSILAAVGMAACVLCVGAFYGCGSYLAAFHNRLERGVRESVSADVQLERAKVLLGAVDRAVEEAARDVARNEVEIARVEELVGRREEELAQAKKLMGHLKELVKAEQAEYVIAGRTVSQDELRDELVARWRMFESLQASRDRLGKSLRELRRRRAVLKRGLADLKLRRAGLDQRIEVLETELAAVRSAERAGEVPTSRGAASAVAELAQALDEVEVAVRAKREGASGLDDADWERELEGNDDLPKGLREFLSEEGVDGERDRDKDREPLTKA